MGYLQAFVLAITASLAALFNVSLDDATFPSNWKQANVFLVYKGGDSYLLINYRPISVLPSIVKAFESIAILSCIITLANCDSNSKK